MLVLSTKLPSSNTWETVSIPDSLNLTTSPTTNSFAFKYTKFTSVAFGISTICATARLSWPTISSPFIAFVSRDKPDTNLIWSKTGLALSFDS